MQPARTAFADESLRVRDGLYILAAVIVADADADRYRDALRALRQTRQARLHWRDENSKRRSLLAAAVRHMPQAGLVVVASGMTPGRQERARRKCIERILTGLAGRQIPNVVFERRHPELDARDRVLVAALRRQASIPATLAISWQPASAEPLLWLADIAAGTAALAQTGDDTYWKELAAAFTVSTLGLG